MDHLDIPARAPEGATARYWLALSGLVLVLATVLVVLALGDGRRREQLVHEVLDGLFRGVGDSNCAHDAIVLRYSEK